jgi:hypothetical protein
MVSLSTHLHGVKTQKITSTNLTCFKLLSMHSVLWRKACLEKALHTVGSLMLHSLHAKLKVGNSIKVWFEWYLLSHRQWVNCVLWIHWYNQACAAGGLGGSLLSPLLILG